MGASLSGRCVASTSESESVYGGKGQAGILTMYRRVSCSFKDGQRTIHVLDVPLGVLSSTKTLGRSAGSEGRNATQAALVQDSWLDSTLHRVARRVDEGVGIEGVLRSARSRRRADLEFRSRDKLPVHEEPDTSLAHPIVPLDIVAEPQVPRPQDMEIVCRMVEHSEKLRGGGRCELGQRMETRI